MNWRVKFNYTFVGEKLPPLVPVDIHECVITDDITKVKFPHPETIIEYEGHPYNLISVDITLTRDKILV